MTDFVIELLVNASDYTIEFCKSSKSRADKIHNIASFVALCDMVHSKYGDIELPEYLAQNMDMIDEFLDSMV